MSEHHCPTGWHVDPQVWCRTKHGCRCDGCVADYRLHWREKQRRLHGYGARDPVDAETTRAKMRVLIDAGWSRAGIARAVGCHRKIVEWTVAGVDRRVSERVRAGVDRLWRESMRAAS